MMALATGLMSLLRTDTPLPIVWFWMFLAGLGVGPTFAVFTIIVQNAVPFHELGVATSNLTFFRQIGGTVSLAIVGTLFASSFKDQLVPSLTAAGVPGPLVANFSSGGSGGGFDFNSLTGTGDLGTTILAQTPAQFRPLVEPYVGNIVNGIHDAFSLAVASTFWIGVVAAIVAALAAATMHELALRPSPMAAPTAQPSERPTVAA